MAEGERDSTQDWSLSAGSGPATVAQLEQRIDHALAVARASEAAALEIGAAALDAAQQARRAAELAERASAAPPPSAAKGAKAQAEVEPETQASDGVEGTAKFEPAEPEPFNPLEHFSARADHLSQRLLQLAPVP